MMTSPTLICKEQLVVAVMLELIALIDLAQWPSAIFIVAHPVFAFSLLTFQPQFLRVKSVQAAYQR